jgi:hypothetical protein
MTDNLDDDLAGMTGRITIPVSADGPGEIMVAVRGGVEAFTAYTFGGEELPKNARAAIVEKTGPRTVLVTGC